MVKINGGSIEPDEHSLSLKAGKDGNSASLGDMCLVSLATDKGDRYFLSGMACRKA